MSHKTMKIVKIAKLLDCIALSQEMADVNVNYPLKI